MTFKSKLGWFALLPTIMATAVMPNVSSAQTANAAVPVAVLELFTSQGCSSCPAADAVLKNYTGRKDIIALSFSVDYWDYLGWKDTLGSPKFTKRQRAYAVARGDGQVYTPQLVVNGLRHVVGSITRDIDAAIQASSAEFAKVRVPMSASLKAGIVAIEIGASPSPPPVEGTVWIAIVQTEVTIAVRSGENGGRKLTYHNVVRDLIPAGMWSGTAATIRLQHGTISQAPAEQVVVLLQKGLGGPIVGATRLDGPRS